MTDQRVDELETLYRERFRAFLRVATAITHDEERGYDAVQEGFATAIRKRSRFRREGPLEAWVWRIVVNAARKSRSNTTSRSLARPSVPCGPNVSVL